MRDTGTGIPADEIPKLFERFYRVTARGDARMRDRVSALRWLRNWRRCTVGRFRRKPLRPRQAFTVAIPAGQITAGATYRRETHTASTALGAGAFVEEALRWLPGRTLGAK